MSQESQGRRAERAEQAAYQLAEQQRRTEREAEQAQVLIDRFVARARQAGLAAQPLTARPWTGRGRYRTAVVGWYLRKDRSVGVGEDGGYYQLLVPPDWRGRWRTVPLEPTPPPLQVGRGARDGESVALDALLEMRLDWPEGSTG